MHHFGFDAVCWNFDARVSHSGLVSSVATRCLVVACLICMQVVRSAQTYRLSLLSESFSVLLKGTQSLSSECLDVPPAASSGVHCRMRRWLVPLWWINGTVINLTLYRNTSTIYSIDLCCSEGVDKLMIVHVMLKAGLKTGNGLILC